jgi:hypothetical protein
MVVTQDPAEPVAPPNRPDALPDLCGRLEDLIAFPLMRSLGIVTSDELMESAVETLLAEEDHAVQQLAPQPEDEALGYRGETRRSYSGTDVAARSAPRKLDRSADPI